MDRVEDVLRKKYISVGTQNIYLEKWLNIYKRFDNYSFKSCGGLWATIFYGIEDYVCEWLDLLSFHNSYGFGKNLEDGVIFSLKKDTKLCLLETSEDMENINEQYPSLASNLTFYNPERFNDYYHIDYSKLSENYDAFYMSYMYIDKIKKEESTFGCSSLIIANPSCIEMYTPISLYQDEDTKSFNILEMGKEKHITPLSMTYRQLEIEAMRYLKGLIISYGIDYINYDHYLCQMASYGKLLTEYLSTDKNDVIIKIIDNRIDLLITDITRAIAVNCITNVMNEFLVENYENFLENKPKSATKRNYESVLVK